MTATKKEYVDILKKKLDVKNIHMLPKVESVVVSMGIWSIVTRKWQKDFEEFEKNLKAITWQKCRLIVSKKSISNFKLREGMPVMLQCTLRKDKAIDFLDRFAKVVLPRVRDFSWFIEKKFDKNANYNMGLKNYNIFPELWVDDVTIPMWLGITIVTNTNKKEESKLLLESLGFVFMKK